MAKTQCPLPHVEDALAPYIHSREKTTRIRQILTQSLSKHVHSESEISHLSLSSPSLSLQANGASLSSNGLYQQYLQALLAHRKAQERYDTVKSELNELLEKNAVLDNKSDINGSVDSAREHAKILRQRRQHRKLEIIQDALTRLLETEPNPSQMEIKAAVKEKLGEPPQAPVASFDVGRDSESRIEDLTFQLKKELLIARTKYTTANTAKTEAEVRGHSDHLTEPEEAVAALRNVRDELIAWVEGELAKIPEDEVEASQADISFIIEDEVDTNSDQKQLSSHEVSSRIDELYNNYLLARKRYITNVEATMECAQKLERVSSTQSGTSFSSPPRRRPTMTLGTLDSNPTTSVQPSQVLPYLAAITAMTKDESLLQQQTSHLRRQMSLASDETDAVVQRLAGESLLVPQGSSSISAWAKASEDAGTKTKRAVLEHIKEGETSVGNASAVLEGLETRKQALGGLKRDL